MIQTYQVIQRDPEPLIRELQLHAANHSKDYYYEIRSQHQPGDPVAIAARFIYLNKTCYNGLWRVNSKGEFNVPMGSYVNPAICDEANLHACHKVLQSVSIYKHDFQMLVANDGDFIYFDPPYQPLENTSFIGYARNGFDKADQARLRDVCLDLHKRGANVMVSNSDTEFIRALYSNEVFTLHEVRAPRMVNSKGNARGAVNELIITTF